MSDNIPPDLIERELEAQFRIPTEVWTDVFKLLLRRILVKNISPVCYRFKEISDKNVKNVHVIKKADWFCHELEMNCLLAKKQLEHLAGNDCQLAGQFRLAGSVHLTINEKSQAILILRHCPDLFNGCRIKSEFNEKNKSSTLFLECLSHLDSAKLVQISVDQNVDQVIDFWHRPTFQHCTRVHLYFCSNLSTPTLTTAFVNIFDWLHHRQPNAVADQQQQQQQVVPCMIVWLYGCGYQSEHMDWLFDRCSHELQQGQGPTDRRPFVLSFFFVYNSHSYWTGFDRFRLTENKSTGEVLLLDRLIDANGRQTYRLRRCLAEEEANGSEFYAGMFKRNYGCEEFNIDKDNTPKVAIE